MNVLSVVMSLIFCSSLCLCVSPPSLAPISRELWRGLAVAALAAEADVACSLLACTLFAQGTSKWISIGDGGRLQYGQDARGNRIMDFSHAGYKGGGVPVPSVRRARVLQPVAGDNIGRI